MAGEGEVAEFWLDATEVTQMRWERCHSAGNCRALEMPPATVEPGLPVTNVTAADAEVFCAWAGGRLPRRDEWLRVTAGPTSRRFPWGQTGLVCRRASFGLVHGPCAELGTLPDWSGARPDGASELGLLDLVGNVAEIVKAAEGAHEVPSGAPRSDRAAQAAYDVRGGSYRSDHAAELKSWATLPYHGGAPDIGFRCAYDQK